MSVSARTLATVGLVLSLVAAAPAAQQNPPAGTTPPQETAPPAGAITGIVIDGSTGQPVADAIVAVSTVQPGGSPLPAGYAPRQLTDSRGRFVFQNLPEGTFQIRAGKFGYLDGGYGRENAPTDPLRSIVLGKGAWVRNVRVPIWTAGAVSGTVRDEGGEPVVGVFVRAFARFRLAGRDELAAGPVTVTDDHGQYRMSGLLPGRYLIQVPSVQMSVPAGTKLPGATTNVPEGVVDVDDTSRLVIGRYPLPPPRQNGRAMAYAGAFHPNGSLPAQATVVEIKYGEDRSGIDIALTPSPGVRVSGVVEGPPEALTTLTLRLLPAGLDNLGVGAEVATAFVGANGAFTFLNVPAGDYVLDAPLTFNQYSMTSGASLSGGFVGLRGGNSLPPPPPRSGYGSSSFTVDAVPGLSMTVTDFRNVSSGGTPPMSARMPLTVGTGDVTGISMRLRPNAVLRGRVVAEPDTSKPGPQQEPRFFMLMDAASGQARLGAPRSSMSNTNATDFEITGIQPGEYFLRPRSITSGWIVKSIQWRGRDYLSAPFDAATNEDISGVLVTVTNAPPTLSGTVRMQDGSSPVSSIVIVFPVQAALRVNAGTSPLQITSQPVQSDGTFRLNYVPAGDYFVAAIERSRMATWRDPDFLATVERQATRVTLSWGQTIRQDLTTVVIR